MAADRRTTRESDGSRLHGDSAYVCRYCRLELPVPSVRVTHERRHEQ